MAHITERELLTKYDSSLDHMNIRSVIPFANSYIIMQVDNHAYENGLKKIKDNIGIVKCSTCFELFDDPDDLENGTCEDCRELEAEPFEPDEMDKII